MGRGMGKVQEKRLIVGSFGDHLDGFVGDRVGEINVIRVGFDATVVFEHVVRGEEIVDPVNGAVKPVKPTLAGRWVFGVNHAPAVDLASHEIPRDMPFAGQVGFVTRSAQMFGNGRVVVAQKALIGGRAQIGPHMSGVRVMGV